VREWDTDLLADPSLFDTMSLVRLPDGLVGEGAPAVLNRGEDGKPLYDYYHAGYIGDKLHHDYKIEVLNIVCLPSYNSEKDIWGIIVA